MTRKKVSAKMLLHWYSRGKRDFSKMNLSNIDLAGCSLRDIDFSGANLRNACLISANLANADLSRADLRNSHLGGANLDCARLFGANLFGARKLNPLSLLLADWSCFNLDQELCNALMHFDAAFHPKGETPFQVWAQRKELCPYSGLPQWTRAVRFNQSNLAWRSEQPSMSPYQLLMRLFQAAHIKF